MTARSAEPGPPGPGAGGPASLGDQVEALWQRFAPLVAARVKTVEAYADDRAAARAAAHALAGALGSYGRPAAGAVAAQLDRLLAEPSPDPALLADLAAQLRADLTSSGLGVSSGSA